MIKELTKSQEAALDEMSPSEWYSVYELDASRKTLEGLYDMGLLYKHGSDNDSYILFRKIEKCEIKEQI